MKEKHDTRPGRALGSNGFRGNSELDILKDIARRLKELNNKDFNSGSSGDSCCPATNILLEEIKTAIQQLDISVDNLVLNTDTLEINTDGLEALLTTLNGLTQTESDETQVLLTDIKTNLQSIIDKLNQPCGVDAINVNVCGSSGEQAIDTFQIKDCTGTDIGSPQEVKKTIVLNNITTSICNFQELADAIISGFPTNPPIVNYNNEEELIITPNTTYNITANSVHAYSLNVKGTGTQSTISINGAIPLPISNGYSKQIEFSTTNSFSIDIFCDTNDTIRLIKQF